jgi:hypothetical protein
MRFKNTQCLRIYPFNSYTTSLPSVEKNTWPNYYSLITEGEKIYLGQISIQKFYSPSNLAEEQNKLLILFFIFLGKGRHQPQNIPSVLSFIFFVGNLDSGTFYTQRNVLNTQKTPTVCCLLVNI